jgi:hypothetical protein
VDLLKIETSKGHGNGHYRNRRVEGLMLPELDFDTGIVIDKIETVGRY